MSSKVTGVENGPVLFRCFYFLWFRIFATTVLCKLELQMSDVCCFNNSVPLSQGTQSILEEESHIKDVLSRIVVEMIKREWPQRWPDMLKELDTLSKQGV